MTEDSKAAFMRAVQLLVMESSPADRELIVRNAAEYSDQGKWIPAITAAQLPVLFYPLDPDRQRALAEAIHDAQEAGELPNPVAPQPMGLLPLQWATWAGLPPVPIDSPLAHWLPEFLPREHGMYVPLSLAASEIAMRIWHKGTENVAAAKLKEMSADKVVYPGTAHVHFAVFYETPRIQKKIDSLISLRRLPLYEWPSRIRTTDRKIARVNREELIKLLMSGEHLADESGPSHPDSTVDGVPQSPAERSAPRVSSERNLQRKTLIAEYGRRWPTVEQDLKYASSNGLTQVAKGDRRGWWREEAALEWARVRNKLRPIAATPPVSSSSVFNSAAGQD